MPPCPSSRTFLYAPMRCPSRDASRSAATSLVAASNADAAMKLPACSWEEISSQTSGPHGGIAGTRLIQEARSRVAFTLEARFHEFLSLFPLLRRHRDNPSSLRG